MEHKNALAKHFTSDYNLEYRKGIDFYGKSILKNCINWLLWAEGDLQLVSLRELYFPAFYLFIYLFFFK